MAILSARLGFPLTLLGILLIVANLVWGRLASAAVVPVDGPVWMVFVAVPCLILGALMASFGPARRGEALPLAAPVTGTWQAINSPGSKVPSHGTHGLGQAYALDILYDPERRWSLTDREPRELGTVAPQTFASFGRPILAPAAGVVVTASDGRRDHLARTSEGALVLFYIEAFFRQLAGRRAMLGNHVVLRLEDGSHLVLAHLQKGSLEVRRRQVVGVGEVLGRCGNSGNTTEPHLHLQRQDVAHPGFAAGLPWTLIDQDLPGNGEFLTDRS